MRREKHGIINPWPVKEAVARMAKQFSDWMQQVHQYGSMTYVLGVDARFSRAMLLSSSFRVHTVRMRTSSW
jgi:hypothetical protein